MSDNNVNLDKIVHERARLLILTFVASSSDKKVAFNDLKQNLGFTSGNLSVQLRNLEKAGYIEIEKKITNRKPETNVSLTPEGLKALKNYISEMESLINSVKNQGGNKND